MKSLFIIILFGLLFTSVYSADSDTSGWSVQQFTDAQARVWAQYVSFYVTHGAIMRAYRQYEHDIAENTRLTPCQKSKILEQYLEFKRTHSDIIARSEKYHAHLDSLAWGKAQAWDRRHRI